MKIKSKPPAVERIVSRSARELIAVWLNRAKKYRNPKGWHFNDRESKRWRDRAAEEIDFCRAELKEALAWIAAAVAASREISKTTGRG